MILPIQHWDIPHQRPLSNALLIAEYFFVGEAHNLIVALPPLVPSHLLVARGLLPQQLAVTVWAE